MKEICVIQGGTSGGILKLCCCIAGVLKFGNVSIICIFHNVIMHIGLAKTFVMTYEMVHFKMNECFELIVLGLWKMGFPI